MTDWFARTCNNILVNRPAGYDVCSLPPEQNFYRYVTEYLTGKRFESDFPFFPDSQNRNPNPLGITRSQIIQSLEDKRTLDHLWKIDNFVYLPRPVDPAHLKRPLILFTLEHLTGEKLMDGRGRLSYWRDRHEPGSQSVSVILHQIRLSPEQVLMVEAI